MPQKPITQQAIDSMREIGVGIVLGRFRHRQHAWHCGSGHCYAGWNTALNHAELYKEAIRLKRNWLRKEEEESQNYRSWGIDLVMPKSDEELAREDWGINATEASFMFSAFAELADQIGLVEFLADGYRIYNRDQLYTSRAQSYRKRYQTKEARLAWAKQYDQPRPEAEFVGELLCQAQGKEVLEEIVEIEVCQVTLNR